MIIEKNWLLVIAISFLKGIERYTWLLPVLPRKCWLTQWVVARGWINQNPVKVPVSSCLSKIIVWGCEKLQFVMQFNVIMVARVQEKISCIKKIELDSWRIRKQKTAKTRWLPPTKYKISSGWIKNNFYFLTSFSVVWTIISY